MSGDAAIGAIVLVGDFNWRKGPRLAALAAWAFGRRERFDHLGRAMCVAWWRDKPYLISIRELGHAP